MGVALHEEDYTAAGAGFSSRRNTGFPLMAWLLADVL